MNQVNPQVSHDSEDNQHSLISYSSQDNDTLTGLPPEQTAERFLSSEDANDMNYAEQSHSIYQPVIVINTQNQIPPVHPTVFFYQPPNDFYHYRVICEKIPYDTIEQLLKKLFINDQENITQFKENEYVFCYQQKCNSQFYQVLCEIVPSHLVNNCLSKTFLGIEFQQNVKQECLAFTLNQKENLEYYLKQYLSQYLLN